ncbi:MAG: ankyrin repeat domain-containing protein [Gemmatimonas sp.]
MSNSNAVDALKAHAKQLLALARANDVTVITALRKSLPRLAKENDADFAAHIKLADVQHAIATQRRVKSWAELKRLVESTDPLRIQTERFLHAIFEDQKDRAKELLAAHPAISKFNIHAAAAACDTQAVEDFLQNDPSLAKAKAEPNNAEPLIYACGTPLHDAYAGMNEIIVSLLLQSGGNPNTFILFNDGERDAPIPALYFAANGNNVPATRLLLEHGANPNDGESIYHSAERNNRDCMALLLKHGADISSAHADWGNTPLYFIAGHKPFSRLCASSEQGMLWLLEHGANPNVVSNNNEKNATSPTRAETPLHRIASYGKSVDVARMLVDHGAIIDLPRGDGRTAFVLAVRAVNELVATYLAEQGANATVLTPADRLVAECLSGHEEHARALIAEFPTLMTTLSVEDKQTLALAAEEGRENSVRVMASLGWDLSAEGAWGGSPLHHAAWHGNVSMTQLLVDLGAPVNFRDSSYGSSPLAWAAHGSVNGRPGHDDEYCAVTDILLRAGSTREAAYNTWGEAPESLASKRVARLLKERGFAS